MPYQLVYHPDVTKIDLLLINRNIQNRIQRAIEQRLLSAPFHYGAPLRQDLKGYRKLRVGDYRIIYEICGIQVKIHAIGHRKEIYELPPRFF